MGSHGALLVLAGHVGCGMTLLEPKANEAKKSYRDVENSVHNAIASRKHNCLIPLALDIFL